ncbi:ASPIC/UnbV domain-containing protein [Parasedimentitalea marina]|nr:ASPIC/UnbV domain-containing protein [Parasedimentitalea marina]
MTATAAQFDLDGDGDLDLVTHPVNGPLALFRNTAQGSRLVVELEDLTGNRAGIGARITLLNADGSAQMRELQLGGGFMSFDAPRAHFGLAGAQHAAGLQILWPDGVQTQLKGPLSAGQLYRITRHPRPE